MFRFVSTRAHRATVAWLAAMLLAAAAVPVGAAGPPGNNGTVKIHSGPAGTESGPAFQNEPQVGCPFYVDFFFADTDQQGDWTIVAQPPGGDTFGANGSYDTGADTSFMSGEIRLGAGHYELQWQGRNEQNVKQKTFWVEGECSGGG